MTTKPYVKRDSTLVYYLQARFGNKYGKEL